LDGQRGKGRERPKKAPTPPVPRKKFPRIRGEWPPCLPKKRRSQLGKREKKGNAISCSEQNVAEQEGGNPLRFGAKEKEG